MCKINIENKRWWMDSKLIIETPELCHLRRSAVLFVIFEPIELIYQNFYF